MCGSNNTRASSASACMRVRRQQNLIASMDSGSSVLHHRSPKTAFSESIICYLVNISHGIVGPRCLHHLDLWLWTLEEFSRWSVGVSCVVSCFIQQPDSLWKLGVMQAAPCKDLDASSKLALYVNCDTPCTLAKLDLLGSPFALRVDFAKRRMTTPASWQLPRLFEYSHYLGFRY